MADPFLAEIRILACNFAPKGWATCDGQVIPLSQNTALFSLLGVTYGGNGSSTFALPNLQGNAPMQQGQSNSGTFYDLGQIGGSETVTLLLSQMPSHNHAIQSNVNPANLTAPSPTRSLARSAPGSAYTATLANLTPFDGNAIQPTGGNAAHNNLMPYLTLNFCIAMQGVFPQRP